MQVDVDLNEKVIVYLTSEGKNALFAFRNRTMDHLRAYPLLGKDILDTAFNKYTPAPDSTYMTTMWELMAIFGPSCVNGAQLFQENKIILGTAR